MYSQPSLPYNGIIQTLFEKFLREVDVVGGGLVDVAAGAQFLRERPSKLRFRDVEKVGLFGFPRFWKRGFVRGLLALTRLRFLGPLEVSKIVESSSLF